VAARRTSKLQANVRDLLEGLEDLESRLLRLDGLLEATRKAEREKARQRAANQKGIRGKGPNVRDVAYQILARRRRPRNQEIWMSAEDEEGGGDNFTQNLRRPGQDSRFLRVGRGLYAAKR
jgi:hypothetical protein